MCEEKPATWSCPDCENGELCDECSTLRHSRGTTRANHRVVGKAAAPASITASVSEKFQSLAAADPALDLPDDEFEAKFDCTKSDFADLPRWKQSKMKKDAGMA